MKHSKTVLNISVSDTRSLGAANIRPVKEAGRTPPPYPTIFIKPRDSVAGFEEDIPVPKIAQDDQCDWEGELSIIVGKTGKNITKETALEYVAGYVVSNDISARKWQRDPKFAGSVPQFCFSKGFDKWAPLGPMIVSPALVGDAGNLALQTLVDGVVRQESNTNDLIFGVRQIIEFISQGTTLEKGTVIMTGTPSGVALGMENPPWLRHGQIVEVKIEELGSVKNKMRFE
jgi:2-keto-4-pentenoate hydratase/2-oxohepta-3-ene-1,7-dioic acid hydratase in catechol pathway